MHEGMDKIIKNMETMSQAALSEDVAGIVKPLGVMGRESHDSPVQNGIDLPMDPFDQPGVEEEAIEIEEGISAGAMDRLIDAMLASPKAKSMLARFGVAETDIPKLKVNMIPAVTGFFAEQGVGVAGASKAKAALRGMAKF